MRAVRRLWAGGVHRLLAATQAVGDYLPPSLRYGDFRTATKVVLRRPSMAVVSAPARVDGAVAAGGGAPRVALLADRLDSGGVETVVSLLARRLPEHGLAADVICAGGGRVAAYLRGAGIRVVEAPTREEATRALAALAPDVIQLHSTPGQLIEAARAHGAPLVPVVHTTDLYRSPDQWEVQSAVAEVAFATIAVSAFVGEHHRVHLNPPMRGPLVVVPNGAPTGAAAASVDRAEARLQVGSALGLDLGNDALAVCLARCDPQKNLPGLVAGFLQAARTRPALRLVVAGGVQDWLEFSKADSARRASPAGDRVHFLGVSDAGTLLAAADMFVLDSFFEGWPVAATEAVVSGLPLVITDVGGARELVGPGGERGLLVPNPAASGIEIDQAAIRRARRARVQRNRAELVRAIVSVHDDLADWTGRRATLAREASLLFDEGPMVAGHARVLLDAAASRCGPRTPRGAK